MNKEGQGSFEVINAGGISYANYRVVVLLKELLAYEPDLIVIYTGHNKFLETRTYESSLDQSLLVFKTRELLSHLKIYRLLTRGYLSLRKRLSPVSPDTGHRAHLLAPEVETLLDRNAGMDYYQRDSLFSRGVFEHFRYNVGRMIRLCRKAGVDVVFLRPVDNLKDFSPFKNQHDSGLDSRDRQRFGYLMNEGAAMLNQGRLSDSIGLLTEALTIDSLFAEVHFRLGRACLESGDTALAGRYLLQARELDICPLRAQEPVHRILQQETVRHGVDLLDLPGIFRSRSAGGIIGNQMLVDHIHPSPAGHLLIALELMRWMKERGMLEGICVPEGRAVNEIYERKINSLPRQYFTQATVNLAKVLIWAGKYRETFYVLDSQKEKLADHGEAQLLLGVALLKLDDPETSAMTT